MEAAAIAFTIWGSGGPFMFQLMNVEKVAGGRKETSLRYLGSVH
jgi:hypothetical protein